MRQICRQQEIRKRSVEQSRNAGHSAGAARRFGGHVTSVGLQLSEPKSSQRAQDLSRVGSRAVDAQVDALRRQGHRVLPLKPHPERPIPPHVIEAAMAAVHERCSPPSRGLLRLREAIATRLQTEMAVTIDPEEHVLVTNGGMQALFVAFASLFDHGDEVLVPAPCFFLDGIAHLMGVRLRYVPMEETERYRWDHKRLETALTSRTRAIFVNTPVNPTGYVLTDGDLQRVARLASEHNLWVLADESYDRMVYDGRRHLSIFSLSEARPRTVLIRSCTKSYAMPAWRVGYLVAPSQAVAVMTKAFEWQCLYGNSVCQSAAAAALAGPQDWLADVPAEFQANRDTMCRAIAATEGLACVVPQGGPFVFINVSAVGVDGDFFARRLLYDYGVPGTPGSTMRARHHVRIAFGGEPATVEDAAHRISRAARDLQQ
jgi:aspartate/methionine/tyrosine aminotransferase